jgi:hypothetical protein
VAAAGGLMANSNAPMMTASSKWTWSDFIRRCRSRSLGWDDLRPLSNRIIIPWFIFSGLGLFLIDTEDGLFQFAHGGVVLISWALPWIAFFGFLSFCATSRGFGGAKALYYGKLCGL